MFMGKKKIAKLLSAAVIIAGIMVMIGWIFDIGFLKSVSPVWVSMKFDTALSFVLSGVTLYFIVRAQEGEFDRAQVVLSITTLIIILIMGILFFSAFLGVNTGAESLFVREAAGGVKTVIPGRPSVATMVSFMLVALAGIMTMLNAQDLRPRFKAIGIVVGLIGATAVAGYIINVPLLYYYIAGIDSAMAFHTAISFVLLGIGLLCL